MTEPPLPAPPYAAQYCYRHPGVEAGVRCARCDRPICPACMVSAAVGFQCPECVRAGAQTVRAPRTPYGGRVTRGGIDVTRWLISVNVVIYLITAANGGSLLAPRPDAGIYNEFALLPVAVAHGQWYRLISSMFLHYNVLHIAFNMWALYVVGTPLERLLGRVRYLALYFLSGIGGALLSMSFGPLQEYAAGASGAIFGLFGAFYVITRSRGLQTGGIALVIVLNLVFSFTYPGIDWRGHVGGLVVGAVLAAVYAFAPAGPGRDRWQALGVGVVAVLLAAGGFAGAVKVSDTCPHYLLVHHRILYCGTGGSGSGVIPR